jgi:hypothetical protein
MKKHCDHEKINQSRDFERFTGSDTPEYVKVVFGTPPAYLSIHLCVCLYVHLY